MRLTMDDRWQRRAAALKTADERFAWKMEAIKRLIVEASAERDAAIVEANAMIPKAAPPKPRDRLAEKAKRIVAAMDARRSAQG